jgi:hypothetical protein
VNEACVTAHEGFPYWKHSAQEVYDFVVRHLRTQKKRSVMKESSIETETCAYRSPEGLMCAAGCLIPDERYSPSFEGLGWRLVVTRYGFSNEHYPLIRWLQAVHDNCHAKDWEEALSSEAHFLGVNYTKENE